MRRLLPKRFQYDPIGLGHRLADLTVIGLVLLAMLLALAQRLVDL